MTKGMNASQVHSTLARNLLADGLDLVMDLEKSQGSRIYDSKRAKFFIDFFSCFATCPLGYNHARLVSEESIQEFGRVAINKPSSSDTYTVEMARFVETFERLAKPPFARHLFFIEGGTLAVENALKAAFDWKVRLNLANGKSVEPQKVIHFKEAFHGRSGYTLSLTNTDPGKTKYFPKFDWPRISNPKCRFPLKGPHLEVVRDHELKAVEEIKAALSQDRDRIACLIIEPIQGEGGDNHFRPEFHQQLRDLCSENDVLFIYDEVQTGLGATGRMWAHEYFVEPDIVAFGKKTQVCGIMVGERIEEVQRHVFEESSRLNSTWGGNLIDMYRCRRYLEVYEAEEILERSLQVGRLLMRELEGLQEEMPEMVSNVRGKGPFCAFDLPSNETRDKAVSKLFELGLIILKSGENSIRFRTALNIPDQDLLEGLGIIHAALKEVH